PPPGPGPDGRRGRPSARGGPTGPGRRPRHGRPGSARAGPRRPAARGPRPPSPVSAAAGTRQGSPWAWLLLPGTTDPSTLSERQPIVGLTLRVRGLPHAEREAYDPCRSP